MCIFNEINLFAVARGTYSALINTLHARKFSGADPGFLERGFICLKLWGGGGGGGGGCFADFISFFLNIP